MKDQALRRKLSELGIPNDGSRAMMEKRHIEWVNLVNANCDSRHPLSRKELLNQLQLWGNSQNSTAIFRPKSGEDVMQKDFDHQNWSTKHNTDFQQLIANARAKNKASIGADKKDLELHENALSNGHSTAGLDPVQDEEQVGASPGADRPLEFSVSPFT